MRSLGIAAIIVSFLVFAIPGASVAAARSSRQQIEATMHATDELFMRHQFAAVCNDYLTRKAETNTINEVNILAHAHLRTCREALARFYQGFSSAELVKFFKHVPTVVSTKYIAPGRIEVVPSNGVGQYWIKPETYVYERGRWRWDESQEKETPKEHERGSETEHPQQ